MKINQRIWFFVAFIFAICSTVLLLSNIVTDPGHMMIVIGGDGGHTYHAFLYNIIYENKVWSYSINYPYGENITYIGGLPVFTIPLTHLKAFHFKAEHLLAIMHLTIGLSYILGILYNYKIFRFFNVKPFIAIPFSCLIILISPQIYRLLGHFGLTYTCVIPMLFYWSLKYYNNGHWKYPVYIFISGCIVSFSHLYFGGIIFIWILFYVIGFFIFTKLSFKEKLRHSSILMLCGVSMFLFIKVFIWLTDPIKDRTAFPSGALGNLTNWKNIVTSTLSPFWNIIKTSTWWHDDSNGEGYIYVGIAVILVCIISSILGLILLFKKKDNLIVSDNNFQPIWLFIAIGALLLGMGVPFIWNMAWLLNYMSVFRQFRSLGRFSWIFYYIITVYAVVVINNWYVKAVTAKKYIVAYSAVIVPLFIWSLDAKGYVDFFRDKISYSPSNYAFYFSKQEQNWNQFLKKHNHNQNDFQAIIVLPFFNLGSEKITQENDMTSWVSTTGGKASLQLHLPLVDAYTSRESLSMAEKQVRIIAGPFSDKPLFNYNNKKPFLLLYSEADSLDMDSKYLLKDADYIGHNFGFFIYACYPDRVIANDKKNIDSVNLILPFLHSNDTCIASKETFYVNHFDAGQATNKLFGNGANAPISGDDSIIATISVMPSTDGKLYEFSLWFLLSDKNPYSPNIYLQLSDSAGNLFDTKEILTKRSCDNYNLWFRTSGFFNLPIKCRSIKCKLVDMPKPTYIAMDELLLRPADALVISKTPNGSIMVNNHLFRNEKNQ